MPKLTEKEYLISILVENAVLEMLQNINDGT